jgi:hypothetical protein
MPSKAIKAMFSSGRVERQAEIDSVVAEFGGDTDAQA